MRKPKKPKPKSFVEIGDLRCYSGPVGGVSLVSGRVPDLGYGRCDVVVVGEFHGLAKEERAVLFGEPGKGNSYRPPTGGVETIIFPDLNGREEGPDLMKGIPPYMVLIEQEDEE